MKTFVILFLLCFNSITILGQQTVVTEIDDNGKLAGQSVIEFEDKSAEDIYNKAEEWIAFTFMNTESVTQSKVENKMLRLKGISKSALGPFMGFEFDLSYQIQLDIKEGKLRFTANELNQVSQAPPYTKTSLELLFKKGKLKQKKGFIKMKSQIDETLTQIQESLISQITGKGKDDW